MTNRFSKSFRRQSQKILTASRLSVSDEAEEDLVRGLATVNAFVPSTQFTFEDLPEGLETLLLVSSLWHHLLVMRVLLDREILDPPIDLLREIMQAQGSVKATLFRT